MQPQTQFDRILGICKFISQELFNSSENLSHCSRADLCSDVGFIAISLFQEHCSIDNERRFFEELKTMPALHRHAEMPTEVGLANGE